MIGQKLGSYHVKSQLTFRVLSSSPSTEYPCPVAATFPTLREQAEAQSAILRLRWMTLPFLRKLVPDYIVSTIIRELGARNICWMRNGPVVSPACEPLIQKYLSDYKTNLLVKPLMQGSLAYWEVSWPWIGVPTARVSTSTASRRALINLCNMEDDPKCFVGKSEDDLQHRQILPWFSPVDFRGQLVVLGIGLRDGLVTLSDEVSTYYKWRMICGVEGCRIPKKLLHGPWTDDKCEFLEILAGSNASVDWVGTTSGEVANEGFSQAIQEGNVRAVQALLSKNGLFSSFALYDNNDMTESGYKDLSMQGGVGIVPTTKHLLKAVLEENCNGDIVQVLLAAMGHGIDRDDEALNRWVLKYSVSDEQTKRVAIAKRIRWHLGY